VKNADTGKVAVATTTSPEKAKTWATEEEAVAYLAGRPKSLKGYETCSLS
jgi:hypothetical protein